MDMNIEYRIQNTENGRFFSEIRIDNRVILWYNL